jgi:hypothetical protein
MAGKRKATRKDGWPALLQSMKNGAGRWLRDRSSRCSRGRDIGSSVGIRCSRDSRCGLSRGSVGRRYCRGIVGFGCLWAVFADMPWLTTLVASFASGVQRATVGCRAITRDVAL